MSKKKAPKENPEIVRIAEQIEECGKLLDNLVRASETGDITAIEQSAGAGRAWLDSNPA